MSELATEESLGFSYQIIRSQRKSAAIHVGAKGVQVRIPSSISDEWAQGFIQSKKVWIKKQLALHQYQKTRIPKIEIGQKILFLGLWHSLVYRQASNVSVRIEKDKLVYFGPNSPGSEALSKTLQDWFKQQAKNMLVDKTRQAAGLIQASNKLNDVVFRRTKSKWGHCTSQGRIQYNWLIMGAPLSVIDYLVCHEVCHLLQGNHSENFWNLVQSICPHYKKHKKWLKEYAMELTWC